MMPHQIRDDIIKKDMANKSKDIIIPLLCGVLFYCLYHLLPKINLYVWVAFMFTYGIWFSFVILAVSQYYLHQKFDDKGTAFVIAGTFLYVITLFVYLSQRFELLINFRSLTFLPFNGIIYLVISRIVLELKVMSYDYLLVFIYGTIINYYYGETAFLISPQSDLIISIWIVCFLAHIIQICKRGFTP